MSSQILSKKKNLNHISSQKKQKKNPLKCREHRVGAKKMRLIPYSAGLSPGYVYPGHTAFLQCYSSVFWFS